MGKAKRDVVALGIAAAAVLMFVGTGSAVVPSVIASLKGYGIGPDKMLVNALLLNIALIIFGWRRYRQLSGEVTERRRAEEQAKLLAESDPLTGSLNRRSFRRALDRHFLEATDRDSCVAIMMIDLDNFKQVNDFNGHSAGDQILIECAHRIEALLPPGSLMSRIGGDEFSCAMTFSSDNPDAVDIVALAIVDAIGQPTKAGSATAEITASLGIARADLMLRGHSKHSDAQHLLDMADVAMYHAKRQGRNSYFWFEDFMAEEMQFRSSMKAGIRTGLTNDEFVPFYEQQIDVQTGNVTGFEMLARWKSPEFGLVKPDIFIPIAEEIGLIAQLSERLIALALEDAKHWDPQLSLAVNISPVQLRDPWFSQKLLKLLVEANFPASRLEIEITESCVHEDIVQVRSLIASLKNQGISVSLDDFGTGYSSLSQLRMLPFDRIKIDRSFITSLAESEDNTAILNSIAMLSKGLGLPITAEGIETDAIRELLLDYGDIKGQGYLYGQPKSAEDTHAWLSEKGLLSPHEELHETNNGTRQDQKSVEQKQRLTGNG
ncbi:MAG: EAL domain-containing protein [Sphingomonadaceae bacterium]|nr:EAL domain-containing protein [Sphingomonadaceae bacterium]